MKRKELEKITGKYLHSLEKYCSMIPGSFAISQIHDMRVDYKRLRAFLRLCREEAHARHLDVPEALRNVYRASGNVRDYQLFLAKIMLFAKVQYALPEFTQCLQQQLFKEKEALVKKIEKVEWGRLRKTIDDAMPEMLHDSAIRHFVNRKVAAIHILQLAAEREEDLHKMRKHLKDLVHVSKIFEQDWSIPFPFPAWQHEQSLIDLTEKLGDFNDECITRSFLESGACENIPGEERNRINTWRNMQAQQLEFAKKRLLHEIQHLHLTAQNVLVSR
jgi:CHAD domain-containing protein